ncbi:MAG: sigma-E processing peptidase SpoIIGA [Oscillospiraceae bacterium]|nr:sigma-E processing peptidase SpoIIGA [Oscillospiraceae bacterium]
MDIYVDILLSINLMINYLLLAAAGKLCGRHASGLRLLLAALTGALYALIIFFPQIPAVLLALSKLLAAALMLEIAFPHVSLRQSLRENLVFFAVNFLFAGLMLAVWLAASPAGMIYENSVLYLQLSPAGLILSAAGAWVFTEVFSRCRRRPGGKEIDCEVCVALGGRKFFLQGMVDTGNDLEDALSGTPVSVCARAAFSGKEPPEVSAVLDFLEKGKAPEPEKLRRLKGFRMIPYRALGKEGAISAFYPDGLYIKQEKRWQKAERALLGISAEPISEGGRQVVLSHRLDLTECTGAETAGLEKGERR